MARIRTIKPELFKHEELFDLERESGLPVRVAFMGLFTCCDREGRFKWRPRAMKLDILPYDDCDFEEILTHLSRAGFIKKYVVGSESFGYVPTFLKHQVINMRESKSALPDPNDENITEESAHVHARANTVEPHAHKYRGVNLAPALCATIIARDGGACLRCGAADDLTVDHIFPRSMGGTHVPTNLRTLCRRCNSARPVAGQALIDDLARDGLTLSDMHSMCMHVQARGEGKGKEGKGREEEGKEIIVEQKPLDPAFEIFAFWQKVMQSPKSAMDAKRKALIANALKNYMPADICKAIRGCSKSPHNMGQNDRNTKYNGLNLILRDAEHIDYFINLDGVAARPGAETIEQINARVTAEFLGMSPADENTIEMES